METNNGRQGLYYALGCYLIWGLFPLYWYPINQSAMPADQILAQRIVWSAVFSVFLLCCFGGVRTVLRAFAQPKLLTVFALSSFLIALNWLVYLWAIMNHHILDAGLGYFINPLFNVLLGSVFLKEKLNRTQIVALLLALCGIWWLAYPAGKVPWVALLLAGSFGTYGLIRKRAPMDALPGLALETLLLFPFAAAYLWWCSFRQIMVFGQLNHLQIVILLGSGIATTLPLLLFASAAKRISLSLLGMLQYVSPTLQVLLGLLLFGERFSADRFIGYAWVWAGVAVFLWGMWRSRKAA